MIESQIFSFFGNYEEETDVSKDANGRGIFERIQRAIGKDIDTRVQPYIDGLATNVKDSQTCFDDYVILLLESGGMRDLAKAYTSQLRSLLINMSVYNRNRGTKKCLEALLRLYSASISSVAITEYFNDFSFDSADATLDDPIRRFDMSGCNACADYSVSITSSSAMPSIFISHFLDIEDYWKPIDVKLRELNWNSVRVI